MHTFGKRTLAALLIGTMGLSACVSNQVQQRTEKEYEAARKGPEKAPQKTITNFNESLRCMDMMMIGYGVRDVTLLVEDLADNTKKVSVGTRDMLISAISDMTRRSRAIRLNTFGNDSGALLSFLEKSKKENVYQIVPKYDLRGSISQLDDTIARTQADFGVSLGQDASIGTSNNSSISALGLDLSIVDTDSMTVIPGVTSRNSVAIFKSGKGVDGDATIRKLGLTFTFAVNKNEGTSQAVRNLVELASIELVGKLLKIPYWQCLGTENSPEVQRELEDWYYTLQKDNDLIKYFQAQMRNRGYYGGLIDGNQTAEFLESVKAYRQTLGLNPEAIIDFPFFKAMLSVPVNQVVMQTEATSRRGAMEQQQAAQPLGLRINSTSHPNNGRARPNDVLTFNIRPTRNAFVYCYYKDEKNVFQRIFPNRFTRDAMVSASTGLDLPGTMRFRLNANAQRLPESLMCFATPQDVLQRLPESIRGADFAKLPVSSFEQIRGNFSQVAPNSAEATYNLAF